MHQIVYARYFGSAPDLPAWLVWRVEAKCMVWYAQIRRGMVTLFTVGTNFDACRPQHLQNSMIWFLWRSKPGLFCLFSLGVSSESHKSEWNLSATNLCLSGSITATFSRNWLSFFVKPMDNQLIRQQASGQREAFAALKSTSESAPSTLTIANSVRAGLERRQFVRWFPFSDWADSALPTCGTVQESYLLYSFLVSIF